MRKSIELAEKQSGCSIPLTSSSIKRFKNRFSASHYRLLEDFLKLAKNEIFLPLALSNNEKEFSKKIEEYLPIFTYQRFSAILNILTAYKEDFSKLEQDLVELLEILSQIVQKNKKYLKPKRRSDLDFILYSIKIINKNIFKLIYGDEFCSHRLVKLENLSQLASAVDFYLIFIFLVLEKKIKPKRAKFLNIAIDRLNQIVIEYYHLIKKLASISRPKKFPKKSSVSISLFTKEDVELSEEGLKEYLEMLENEED